MRYQRKKTWGIQSKHIYHIFRCKSSQTSKKSNKATTFNDIADIALSKLNQKIKEKQNRTIRKEQRCLKTHALDTSMYLTYTTVRGWIWARSEGIFIAELIRECLAERIRLVPSESVKHLEKRYKLDKCI